MNCRTPLAIILAIVAAASSAQANVTVDSIGGDANSLHFEFSFNWDSIIQEFGGSGPFSGTVQGSWAGGTFQFVPVVGFNERLAGGGLEGYRQICLRTFWNDGWIPGGMGTYDLFDFGRSDTFAYPLFDVPPSDPATDYSGLGLQYHIDARAMIDFSSSLDTSGNAHITYDISRTSSASVPDSGWTLPLLIGAMGCVAGLRAVGRRGRAD